MNSGKWVSYHDLKPEMQIGIKDGWWAEYRGQWKYEIITLGNGKWTKIKAKDVKPGMSMKIFGKIKRNSLQLTRGPQAYRKIVTKDDTIIFGESDEIWVMI